MRDGGLAPDQVALRLWAEMRSRDIMPDDGLVRDLMIAATRVDVTVAYANLNPNPHPHPNPNPNPNPNPSQAGCAAFTLSKATGFCWLKNSSYTPAAQNRSKGLISGLMVAPVVRAGPYP